MDSKQIKHFAEESIGIVKQMGVKLLELEPGRVVMQMPLLPGNVNHFQTMYAGVQFTLAEVMGGALMMATFDVTNFVPIVGKFDITFVKPATTALTAELKLTDEQIADIKQQLDDNNRAQFETSTELIDQKGDVCAVGKAKYYLIHKQDI